MLAAEMGIVQACENVQVWWSLGSMPQCPWESLAESKMPGNVMQLQCAHHADIPT